MAESKGNFSPVGGVPADSGIRNTVNEGLIEPSGSIQSLAGASSEVTAISSWAGASSEVTATSSLVGASLEVTTNSPVLKVSTEATSKPRLSKKQRKNLRRRQKGKMAEAITPESRNEGEPLSEAGKKRLHSAISWTPSPTAEARAKRTKEESLPRTFAQATQMKRVVIVKDGYPTLKINSEEFKNIERAILVKIEALVEPPYPRIHCTTHGPGVISVTCADGPTEDWVRRSLQGSGILRGFTLRVLSSEELPKPVKVALKTKDTVTTDPKRLLLRIKLLNTQLRNLSWRVLRRTEEPESVRWILEVDFDAADAIKASGMQVFTGLDTGTFKILSDPREKRERAPGVVLPSSEVNKDDPSTVVEGKSLENREVAGPSSAGIEFAAASPLSISEELKLLGFEEQGEMDVSNGAGASTGTGGGDMAPT